MSSVKAHLAREYEIKDLGPLRYFLAIEVTRSNNGVFIFQRKYVLDLLQETGMLRVDRLVHVPQLTISWPRMLLIQLTRRDSAAIFLTRPEIAYAVSIMNQFMHNP